MTIRITTPSRIHSSLIDMNGELGRIEGGFGFTLNYPRWQICLESTDNGLDVNSQVEIEENVIYQAMEDILTNFQQDINNMGIRISIEEAIPMHAGFGSKTQLFFALADGISRLLELESVPYSKEDLAAIVKRGGTSGIGVTSYFQGGFILDGGHAFGDGKEKTAFLPSSASKAKPPPVLMREDLPEDWRVVCAVPDMELGAHGDPEVDIFKENCPVPLDEVRFLAHLTLMKLMPAIKTWDFMEICKCIDAVQEVGFKKVELDFRGDEYKNMLQAWRDAGAPCAGMSSFGPAMYSFAEGESAALVLKESIDQIMQDGPGGLSFISQFQNRGAIITTER